MCCVPPRGARRGHRRAGTSTVSLAWSFMPRSRWCLPHLLPSPGLLGDSVTCHRAQSRQRQPAKSQTNLALSVRSACFATQERNAPCSRLLAGEACTHLAGRSLAAILLVLPICGASRPVLALGAHELCLRVSPVGGRRNERSGSLLHLSADAECSGGQAGEFILGRGRNSAEAWREPKPVGDPRRVSARLGSRKCPLCDATGKS